MCSILCSRYQVKEMEQEGNIIVAKSRYVFLRARRCFFLRVCKVFLFSLLSFLTYFHCSLSFGDEKLGMMGLRWIELKIITEKLFYGCESRAKGACLNG